MTTQTAPASPELLSGQRQNCCSVWLYALPFWLFAQTTLNIALRYGKSLGGWYLRDEYCRIHYRLLGYVYCRNGRLSRPYWLRKNLGLYIKHYRQVLLIASGAGRFFSCTGINVRSYYSGYINRLYYAIQFGEKAYWEGAGRQRNQYVVHRFLGWFRLMRALRRFGLQKI